MSRKTNKGNNFKLPPLQKRIVAWLAERDAQTINETVKGISSHYKPTWIAFNSLKKKGFIEKAGMKSYRNRQYPRFWLTLKGVMIALKDGADIQLLRQNAEKQLGKRQDLVLFFDLMTEWIKEVGRESVAEIYNTFEQTEKGLDLVKLPILLDVKKAKKVLRVLNKYPKWAKRTKTALNEVSKVLD